MLTTPMWGQRGGRGGMSMGGAGRGGFVVAWRRRGSAEAQSSWGRWFGSGGFRGGLGPSANGGGAGDVRMATRIGIRAQGLLKRLLWIRALRIMAAGGDGASRQRYDDSDPYQCCPTLSEPRLCLSGQLGRLRSERPDCSRILRLISLNRGNGRACGTNSAEEQLC